MDKERKWLEAVLVCSGAYPCQQRMTINKEMQMFKSSVCKDFQWKKWKRLKWESFDSVRRRNLLRS